MSGAKRGRWDEAGQIGAKQMLQLFEFVRANGGRLILSGDTRQYESSDAAPLSCRLTVGSLLADCYAIELRFESVLLAISLAIPLKTSQKPFKYGL
jgi:hypothetical protein